MEFTEVKKNEDGTYEGVNFWAPFPGYPAFGGQLAAHSLLSAYDTVDENTDIHSLNILFINPCIPKLGAKYEVQNLKDGKTLQMRQVNCLQNEKIVSTTQLSFSKEDIDINNYQSEPVTLYEDNFQSFSDYIYESLSLETKSEAELKIKYQILYDNLSMLMNKVDVEVGKRQKDMRQIRIKIKTPPKTRKEKAAMLTLISDLLLVETALVTANITFFSEHLSLITSIVHNVNFINLDFELDDYFYYIVKCNSVKNSKATCEGKIITSDGSLICLTSQQGMFRVNTTYIKKK